MHRFLPEAAAHLWVVSSEGLQASPSDALWRALNDTLDGAERTRLQALTFERDRKAFVLAHGLCRAMLGRALAQNTPYRSPYRRGEWGKPRVVGGIPGFGLSHSGQWVAVLVAQDSRCGVDIVAQRPGLTRAAPWLPVGRLALEQARQPVSQVLCGHEHALVMAAPKPAQALLKVLTLKQAYLAAVGAGLMRPLSAFTVLDPQGRICPGDRHLRGLQAHHSQTDSYHLAAWVQHDKPVAMLERTLSLQDVFKLLTAPSQPALEPLFTQAA